VNTEDLPAGPRRSGTAPAAAAIARRLSLRQD